MKSLLRRLCRALHLYAVCSYDDITSGRCGCAKRLRQERKEVQENKENKERSQENDAR
jgi:hypothetical protein